MSNSSWGLSRTAFVAILLVTTNLFLAGCISSPPATLSDFHEHPSSAGFTLIDNRPADDKTSETLSLLVTSCDYAIYRLGDDKTVPSKFVLLKQDLAEAIGGQLQGTTVTLNRYRIFLNSGAALRKTTLTPSEGYPGIIPSIIAGMGSNCSKEETTGGWYAASEVTTPNSPLIIEIESTIEGKSYAIRTVSSPKIDVNYFHLNDAGVASELFSAIRKADAALIAQIKNHPTDVLATTPIGK